jgi:hypothetical protein
MNITPMNTYDMLRKTIANSGLTEQSKSTYLNQLQNSMSNTTTTTTSPISPVVRNIISNPVVNSTMSNLGFNPSAIMRDTYKPGFSFKTTTEPSTQQQTAVQLAKPVNKQNLKRAVIIIKEQQVGQDVKGRPEIIKSSIQVVNKAKKYAKLDDHYIPLNQNQAYKVSDETPLLDEKIVDKRIPFSPKLSKR